MNGTFAVARYTLLELSRRRILLIFFIVGFVGIILLGVGLKVLYQVLSNNPGSVVGSSGPIDPALVNKFLELEFVDLLVGTLGIFALLIAYGIGMTAIYHDLDSGAAVSIFSKPVSRLAFATGKISAAVVALLVIVGLLAIEARAVMILFGGGLENALTGQVLAVTANSVVIMLIVLALSTWMNNIVAAIVAFVYTNVVSGVIVFVHNLVTAGTITNGFWTALFDVLYWLVPHQLTSSVTGDLVRAQAQLGRNSGTTTIAGIPAASGLGDIAWWAFTVVIFTGLVYYAVRRRQV